MACAGCAVTAWLGLYGFAWNDYETEAKPAFDALVAGHVSSFLALAPAYGGSLVERAPFALLPGLWGGGALAVYRMVALPCLLAAAVLGVWLVTRMRTAGAGRLAQGVALGVCVANPVTLRAFELGHPEELLGGCLCVMAVLLAGGRRAIAAGVLLGLAIANKESALLAAGPVLLVLPAASRWRCAGSAVAVAAAVLAPLTLAGSGGFAASTTAVAATSSTIFQPWQVWWFLGHHGPLVYGLFGAPKPGYRVGPAWTGTVSHPLIVLLGAALPAALWWRRAGTRAGTGAAAAGRAVAAGPPAVRRRSARVIGGWHAPALQLGEQDALALLTLLLVLRCLLDTWDTSYYPLPFILALLAWEVCRPAPGPPVLALAASALSWISFQWLPLHASADVQAAFFLAWTLPLAAGLAASLFAPGRLAGAMRPAGVGRSRDQETTVSALGRPVSTS